MFEHLFFMTRHPTTYFRLSLFILLLLAIGGYGLFQMRYLLEGPQIEITAPQNGAAVVESLVLIEGEARNISFISLNDAPIFVDETGQFKEHVLLSYGYNILTVKARDKFGHEVIKSLELMYK